MSTLRLFFAIDLPPAVRQAVDVWRTAAAFPGQPEPAANLHMTLVFLGAFPAASLDALRAVGAAASASLPPFDLQLDRVRRWRNGILHLAPAHVPPELVELHGRLHAGAAALGLRLDRRRFAPHLTLARDCPHMRFPPCPRFRWTVDRLTLFSSERDHEGALVYRPVLEWPIGLAPPAHEQNVAQED